MLKPQEIAKKLGISVSTVRDHADAGLIPCTRTLGGHRRFDLDEVREAIARQRGWGHIARLAEDEAPRLDDSRSAPLPLARGNWRPTIDRASIHDAGGVTARELEIPFIGVPGQSRFTVGGGARA